MTTLVIENLSALTAALGGVEALRRMIRELAIRGRLLLQRPQDDVAPQTYPSVEGPFVLPASWRWVALGAALEMVNGRAFKPSEWKTSGLPIVRIQNLNRDTAEFNYADQDQVLPRHVIDSGTLLISWSGTPGTSFGAFIWNRGKAALNQHIFSCIQRSPVFADRFLQLAINARLDELIAKAHGGVGLQHVTKGKLESLALPLPPLPEQHRIVAKVDELMALCDRLESRQQDAEAAHARLVQALLDSLVQARDAEEFQACWQLLETRFPETFTSEASIDALSKGVRTLAFRGAFSYHGTANWKQVRVNDAVEFLNGYAFKSEWFVSEGIRLVRNVNIAHGSIDWREAACIPVERSDEFARFALNEGDVLLTLDRPIISTGLKVAVVRQADLPCLLLQRVARLMPKAGQLRAAFLLHWLRSPLFTDAIDPGRSNGVPHISTKQVGSMTIPLPALDEQDRVVKQLDKLLALCDQLKARIAVARAKQAQLAEALVEQAVT